MGEEELVDALRRAHGAAAFAQAAEVTAIRELYRRHRAANAAPGVGGVRAGEFAAAEISVAVHVSEGVAAALIDIGLALDSLPRTKLAFAAGRIDLSRVQVIADSMRGLTRELREALEPRLIDAAQRSDPARLRQTAQRWVTRLDPHGEQRRREERETDRDVRIRAVQDGMAVFDGLLPAAGAQTLAMRLREMSLQVCDDDPRTMPQRRADALIALADGSARLHCGCSHGPACPKADVPATPRRPLIQVGVSAETLLGLRDDPAYLSGYGPIDAALARTIAEHARFQVIPEYFAASDAPASEAPRPESVHPEELGTPGKTSISTSPGAPDPEIPDSTKPDTPDAAATTPASRDRGPTTPDSRTTRSSVTRHRGAGTRQKRTSGASGSSSGTACPAPEVQPPAGAPRPGFSSSATGSGAPGAAPWERSIARAANQRVPGPGTSDPASAGATFSEYSNSVVVESVSTPAGADFVGVVPTVVPEDAELVRGIAVRPFTAAPAREVRAIDGMCRFPGCTVPASETVVAHFDPSETSRANPATPGPRAALCSHHHRLKTLADNGKHPWRVYLAQADRMRWVDPTGEPHETRPEGARYLFPHTDIDAPARPRLSQNRPLRPVPTGADPGPLSRAYPADLAYPVDSHILIHPQLSHSTPDNDIPESPVRAATR